MWLDLFIVQFCSFQGKTDLGLGRKDGRETNNIITHVLLQEFTS